MSDTVELTPRRGREGNRWYNERPAPEVFAEWFKTVKLHDGMEHDEWLSGITLIETRETLDEVVGFGDDGRPQIMPDVQHQVYVPYPKTEARTAYFNRLMEERDDWTGFILPVPAPDPQGLPVGYFPVRVQLPEAKGGTASMICYTARVLIIKGDVTWKEQADPDGETREYPTGRVVIAGHQGTKSVPWLSRYGDLDPNAMMKAQTGAVGRALGFAGMLVIPGTGVATAEDMQESLTQGSTPGTGPVAPVAEEGTVTDEQEMRAEVSRLYATLKQHPEHFETFSAWARERKLGKLEEIQGVALKGLLKKLQRAVQEATAGPREAAVLPELDIAGEEDS